MFSPRRTRTSAQLEVGAQVTERKEQLAGPQASGSQLAKPLDDSGRSTLPLVQSSKPATAAGAEELKLDAASEKEAAAAAVLQSHFRSRFRKNAIQKSKGDETGLVPRRRVSVDLRGKRKSLVSAAARNVLMTAYYVEGGLHLEQLRMRAESLDPRALAGTFDRLCRTSPEKAVGLFRFHCCLRRTAFRYVACHLLRARLFLRAMCNSMPSLTAGKSSLIVSLRALWCRCFGGLRSLPQNF